MQPQLLLLPTGRKRVKLGRAGFSFKTLLRFSNSAETQSESPRQNQNWERSDQPYTEVQKHIEKMGVQRDR
jgi:hypothetical protein